MADDKTFIDEEVNIFRGDEAGRRLDQTNDSVYLSEKSGIIKVNKERWESAQRCERKHWMQLGKANSDDRNYVHMENFDYYEILRRRTFSNAIEIGCGPFTNMRLLGRIARIRECSLLDPLIANYLEHPFATYDGSRLMLEKYGKYRKFRHKLAWKFGSEPKPVYKGFTKIKELITGPAEELNLEKKYDLVVMINVIEHCFDIEKVFSNILSISGRESIFIFADKIYNHEDVQANAKKEYDAAHPLKVDKSVIFNFLSDNFKTLLVRRITNSAVIDGSVSRWEDIYFIGERIETNQTE